MLPERLVDDSASGELAIFWPDGVQARLPHRVLRSACKCAACEAQRRRGEAVDVDAGIRIASIHPVGNYALQLIFSDGHQRGIYPWQQLRALSC